MALNVENLVRSGVILVVGLPITIAIAVSGLQENSPSSNRVLTNIKTELTKSCLNYAVSHVDSRLERDAKDEIDKILGADGTDYKSLCDYVLR